MPEWRVHSLSEVYEFASGLSKPRSEFGSGFPFLSFKDVFYNRFVPEALGSLVQSGDAERKKCSIKRGDVFLTRTSETMDELGMSCVSLTDVSDATFNGFTKRLRPKDENYILPEYAGYFFSSPRFRQSVNAMSTMSTRASLNNDMLARLEIVVPEPDEQLRIANVLKPLDDKIELNRRMNETLEEMARALFRDWFVDFGPTRRQIEGATDPAAIMGQAFPPEKATTLAPLFPAKLGEGGLPERWETHPLDQIGNFLNGLALQKFPAQPGKPDLPVIKIAELRSGVSAKSNRASTDLPKKYVINNGDFIFSWSGSLLAKFWTGGAGALNQHLFKVTSESHPMWFVSEWVQTHLEEFQRIAASKAVTMGHIKRSHLSEASCVCPPDESLIAFGELFDPLIAKQIANDEENQTLAALRDLLLPKLMSGEIRLKDMEAEL